jgi:hypothetical protein
LIFSLEVHAQERVITGKVIDAQTKLPLVSCTVYSLNSGGGVITDENGKYRITIGKKTDSIGISMVGYQTIAKPVSKQNFQQIDFEMSPVITSMEAVVIQLKSKYSAAQKLVKKVIQHKDENNVFNNKSYQSKVYDKIEVDLKNIPEKLEKNVFLKPLMFALKNQDTTADNQKVLPVYLSESNANFYYQKNPEKERYDYTAIKSSGVSNKTILAYLDQLYKKLNVYDNNLRIANINFISPVSDNALNFYNYQILDTLYFQNHRCIQVQFEPKQYGSNTFRGFMWIADTSYAIKSVVMHIDKNANINFMNKFEISQNFEANDQNKFFPEKNILYADIYIPELKKTGAIIKKTTLFEDAIVNNNLIDTAFRKKKEDVSLLSSDTVNWTARRFEPLTKSEKSIYDLMDTLNKMPVVNTYKKIISTVGTGYYTAGPVDIGNLYSTFTNNYIEGNRLDIGLQTNSSFNKNLQLRGYIGYATKDEQLKYLVASKFVLKRQPWSTLEFLLSSDISSSYEHADELDQNSVFASFLRRVNYTQLRLLNRKDAGITFKKFFDNGIGIATSLKNSALTPFFNVYYTYKDFQPYIQTKPGVNNDYTVNEATVSLRYSYKEKFITEHFHRETLGSIYPIITLNFTKGIKVNNGILKSDFDYNKWELNIQHDFTDGRIGQLSYTIDAGFVDGVLPVVLLDVQKGNDTYYYNQYAFNNMNRYEFATDKYVSLSVEQTFGSFPFKYIPAIKKLKWRSLVTFKSVLGDMSEANKIANAYYDSTANYHFTIPDKKPYIETGFGIDNIFHLLRIDAVWRLNYLENPGISKFGIKGSIELKF